MRPRIPNPAFKGVWAPRQIENPNYFEPKPFEGLAPITVIGIELWTMSQNIIFGMISVSLFGWVASLQGLRLDNILVSDSEDLAAEVAKQTYTVRRAEDQRLATSQGKGAGIVQGIIDAANVCSFFCIIFILASYFVAIRHFHLFHVLIMFHFRSRN